MFNLPKLRKWFGYQQFDKGYQPTAAMGKEISISPDISPIVKIIRLVGTVVVPEGCMWKITGMSVGITNYGTLSLNVVYPNSENGSSTFRYNFSGFYVNSSTPTYTAGSGITIHPLYVPQKSVISTSNTVTTIITVLEYPYPYDS